jgi:hypothetical protein
VTSVPSPVLEASNDSLVRECKAAAAGEEWANDTLPPHTFTASGMFNFLALLDNHIAFTASQPDTHIPQNYKEAMFHPNLWEVPMQAELEVLQEWKVWSVVSWSTFPADKKVMGC